MVAYETYANALITKGHGHPLWEPDPGEFAPVEIADVGHVLNGGFIKIFNASSDAPNLSNQFGLPPGFSPLPVGPIQCRAPLPKTPKYIFSEGVSEIGANIGLGSGSVLFRTTS